jgi:transposase
VIDPEISKIFSVQDKTVEEIAQKMEKAGYDRSQPVVVWKGKNILVDGHTRLKGWQFLQKLLPIYFVIYLVKVVFLNTL